MLTQEAIVVVRKPNGDVRVCGDYKIGVNHKICSDSYPISNVENILHSFAGMKYFANINLKNAYNQIQIDDKRCRDKNILPEQDIFMANRN